MMTGLFEALEALHVGPIHAVTVESDRVHVRLDALANKTEAGRVADCVRTFYPDHGISVLGGTGNSNALVWI